MQVSELKDKVFKILDENNEVVTKDPVLGTINLNADVLTELIDIVEDLSVRLSKIESRVNTFLDVSRDVPSEEVLWDGESCKE